ncbi:MAG: phosphate ABC transporter substrate-binding protein PstS [Rhodocyclaceae bacterium]|nr:phosphate ABC transporter substrate-binding protein PstS [Rhodocyclaceae bacterium]
MFVSKKWAARLAVTATAALFLASAQAAEITGAGASFPAPLYSKWADAYQKATGHRINYQSIGSGGGIKQITAKTVDFGASDAPMRPEALEKEGFVQFPTVIGGVVPVVNIPGIAPGQMKLTGALIADIYMGKILSWDDKAIAELNPGLKLPALPIQVVRRADGSGTTFIFTNYLSKVSPEWKSTIGEGTAVNMTVGMGGKGNEGVSAFVQRLKGAIGYVEYAYAKQNKMSHTLVKNADGIFVAPDDLTFKAAAANANWSNSYYEILTNQKGKDAWPISGATFIIMHKSQAKPEQGVEVLKFFDWAYKNGSVMAADMDYVPMPDSVVKMIAATWAQQLKDPAGKPIWK